MAIINFFSIIWIRRKLFFSVFSAALIAGLFVSILTPKVYEVAMLAEVRSDTIGPFSTFVPWTIMQTLESGSLNSKIIAKAGIGVTGRLPKLRAKVLHNTQLVKLYTFVPASEIETAVNALLAAYEVIRDGFPAQSDAHSRKVSEMLQAANRLNESKKNIDLNMPGGRLPPGTETLSRELSDWVRGLSEMLSEYSELLQEPRTRYALGVNMVSPPEAETTPIGASPAQTFAAFVLLGFFAGCAVALWAEDRADIDKDGKGRS